MNRRHFIKVIPALAMGASMLPAAAKVNNLPNSIMLVWCHKDNHERCGQQTWNIYCQRSYDQFTKEAAMMRARLVSQNYDVTQHEFSTLRFTS